MTLPIPHTVNFQRYRHIWCFGCSFTQYKWPTWADLLARHYPTTNLGASGAGNQYIFHHILRKHRDRDIVPTDLVMICWTSFYRESRQIADTWVIPGNLWSQDTYPPKFLDFCDPPAMMLRDLDMIEATQTTLRGYCDVVEFSMAPVSLFNQYQNHRLPPPTHAEKITKDWLPSFYEVLWNGNIERVQRTRKDPHPTTEEHGTYLKKVFGWDHTSPGHQLR